MHSCAIGSDNWAYCWGANSNGQLGNGSNVGSSTPVALSRGAIPADATIVQISPGYDHTCVLASNDKVYCWGKNANRQLGNNSSVANSTVSVAVSQGAIPVGVNLIQVSAGFFYTCAMGSNYKVYCWGYNNYGQLGNNSIAQSGIPVAVVQGAIPSDVSIMQVFTNVNHTCALASNNKVYCWGDNTHGQLGNGLTTHSRTPVSVRQGAIPAGVDLVQVSTGHFHTCAIGSNNKAYCWGWNGDGQLGNNSTTRSLVPVAVSQGAVPTDITIDKISAFYTHACVLGSNNKVYCWGDNSGGRLGIGDSPSQSLVPVMVIADSPPKVFVDGSLVAVNYKSPYYMEIIMPAHSTGSVDISISKSNGESVTLSNAYTYQEPTSPQITSLSPNLGMGGEEAVLTGMDLSGFKWKQISSGHNHSCGIALDNKVYCWGRNNYGQLGNNSTANSNIPVAVAQGAIPADTIVNQVSAGSQHTCAVASNGQAYCWGFNNYGQLGNNSTTASRVPVAVAQGAIPSEVSLVDISIRLYHTCALGSDAKVYCWGINSSGQLGNNSTTASRVPVAVAQGEISTGVGIVQVSVGHDYTCVLGSNNNTYCWGINNLGQLGNNSTTASRVPVALSQGALPAGSKLLQVSTGHFYTCALGANHLAYCWGDNAYGQLGNAVSGGTDNAFNPAFDSDRPVSVADNLYNVTVGTANAGNVATLARRVTDTSNPNTQLTFNIPTANLGNSTVPAPHSGTVSVTLTRLHHECSELHLYQHAFGTKWVDGDGFG